MILNRLDTQGALVHGGPVNPHRTREDGAVYRLAIRPEPRGAETATYLNIEGAVAVAAALLDAARWALPGGVEGCSDWRVQEICDLLSDRAAEIEGIDATLNGEVVR